MGIALFEGFVQPFNRFILFVQTNTQKRNHKWRDVTLLAHLLKLIENRLRFISFSGTRVGVTEHGQNGRIIRRRSQRLLAFVDSLLVHALTFVNLSWKEGHWNEVRVQVTCLEI